MSSEHRSPSHRRHVGVALARVLAQKTTGVARVDTAD